MNTKVIVKKSTYRDSISLMKISNSISKLPGIRQAAVVMATELNRRVLSEAGFTDAAISTASTSDMIVAIEAKQAESLDAALKETDKLLAVSEKPMGEKALPTSLEEALEQIPDANLAIISVPGQYAKRETMHALEKGLNVFLFSSNVSRDEEVELKNLSRDKNLLLMGPDCGTSIINHKVLGFGNSIREGTIGLVSASGTGLQEVTTLIHKAGLGITQAIGTGGADLSEQVGGITTVQGLELLEGDKQTQVIVLISKPPAPSAAETVLEAARRSSKPIVVNFLGGKVTSMLGKVRTADTLEDAARIACELSGAEQGAAAGIVPEANISMALAEHKKLASSQQYIRGLFSGGTLCYESEVILQPILGEVFSNAPINPQKKIPGDAPSKKHSCIDMGAEEFVEGRAHPMIDFSLRNLRILQEARDPETAVILVDVELGYGSNDDPAGQLVPAIQKAKGLAEEAGRYLPVVASVIGTEGDSQNLANQEKALSDAGVLIMPSNAQATRISALIASGEKIKVEVFGGSD
jgi:succinyl-CoA synthetase alpha subunit